MKQLLVVLVWVIVLLGGMVVIDQTMMRVTLTSPVLREAQIFYCDFRARLLSLAQTPAGGRQPSPALPQKPPALPQSIEELIEQHDQPVVTPPRPAAKVIPPVAAKKEKKPGAEEVGGYVYVDDKGELHLAGRLEEVPQRYRTTAKAMKK